MIEDMNAFDKQLASAVLRRVGPSQPVDDAAIFNAVTATQAPGWRVQSIFSATKFVLAGAIVALFGIFLLAGVTRGPTDQPIPAALASASPSAGCAQPLAEPGVYDGINDFEDAGQAYRVVVPEGYTARAPGSVILYLATKFGYLDPNWRWWSPHLDPAESIFVLVEQVDLVERDPATLTALIEQLSDDYCLDTRRIHALGASSSSPTVTSLACDASDRIASVFIGVGSFPATCTPERPVPIMAMTGDPDRAAMTTSVGEWSEAYGCDQQPTVEDLGAGVERSEYTGCAADIVLYDIDGGGHGFFRHECQREGFDYCYQNEVFDVLQEAEAFFAEHPLPAGAPTTTSDLLPDVDLVTEEVEPGVYRVLGDTAGHDLVSEPPRRLVVAPDDRVWIGRGKGDNNANFITNLVELGQAGRIGLMGQGISTDAQPQRDVAVDTDGRPWIIGKGSDVQVWEDGHWATARWPNGSGRGDAIATTSDGSVWVARSVNDNTGPRVARIRDGQWEVLPTQGRAGDYPIGWFGFAPSSDGTVWLSCGSLGPGESPCTAPLQSFDGEAWSTIMPVGQRLEERPEERPAWLARGPDDTIWAYFDGGPYHLDGERSLARLRDDSWTVYDDSDGLPQLAYGGGWISSQAVDPQGTLWVTMSWEGPHPDAASASGLADPTDGVMSFDGATWRQYLLGISVDQVTAASDGSIWVLGHPRLASDVQHGLYIITPEAVAAIQD